MYVPTTRLKLLAVILSVFSLFACESTQPLLPEAGSYDGNFDGHPIILVSDSTSNNHSYGYFLFNNNLQLEKAWNFVIEQNDGKLHFRSDTINGILKLKADENKINGKIILQDHGFSIFFWKKRKNFSLQQREMKAVEAGNRYKEQVFDSIRVERNIVYGRARGYWTETPYLDDPYIEILARGMVNLFKGEKELDLMLDLYFPQNDSIKKRPLVMLIHGGAFYIGNKSSQTIKQLAEELAHCGYVVASIDYRMGFRLRASDIERSAYKTLQDAHAALRYLSHHAEKYHIDPHHVYVGGTSAGGIASISLAFIDHDERPEASFSTRRHDDLGPVETSGNQLTDSFTIKGVANMWGAIDDTVHIDVDEQIPVISFHGTIDQIVPFNFGHPFANTLRLNRLIMDEVYGSKAIHERLHVLGIKNQLRAFEDKGHEPQLDRFKTVNELLDTIGNNIIGFYHGITAPEIHFGETQKIISKNKALVPFVIDIENGTLAQLEITGGVKASSRPDDTRIIWLSNRNEHRLKIIAHNEKDAWSSRTIEFNIDSTLIE